MIDRNRATFSIGGRDDHRWNAVKPAIDWNILISETFNAHALEELNLTSSAYAQDWLLMHYLTLNESSDFGLELERYISYVNNGERSLAAFTMAFGRAPNDMCNAELSSGMDRITARQFDFDVDLLDTNFDRSAADPSTLRPVLRKPLINYFTTALRALLFPGRGMARR